MKRGGLYVWTDLWLNAWPWQYHKNVTTQYLKQQCVFIAQSIFYFENIFLSVVLQIVIKVTC